MYPERNFDGTALYRLEARADNGEDLWFTASLLFDHGAGRVTEVQSCAMGTEEELAGASQEAAIETRDRLIRAHLEARYSGVPQWYYLEELPDQAEEGAMCVDSVTLLTTGETDGQRWSLFELSLGLYYSDGAPPLPNWHGGINRTYLALGQREDGSYTEVLGNGEDYAYQLAPQMVSRLLDEEVCLYRDGFYYPVGPGKPLSFSCLDTMHIEEARLEDYEPIYNPGDYWFRSSGQVGGETFTALSYHDSASGRESLNTLDVTMTHLYTPRGIQVGDSREAVLEAYPTAVAGNYWGRYPGEDLLYYIPGLDPEQSDGFYNELGPAILFFFEGDTLRQITLTNMFN